MKKIILILFLFLSCFIIFNLTEDKKDHYVVIGDKNADIIYSNNNNYIYNNNFINQDYRILDLLDIVKYNKELTINNKNISIHRLLKNADILIISIGMNDLYYKINTDTQNIYTYVNEMLSNMNSLLKEIHKYSYRKVFVLGYYNINSNNNDLFTYTNYKLSKIVKDYNFEYIELNNILRNNPNYYKNNNNFILNSQGYREINKIIVEKIKKY